MIQYYIDDPLQAAIGARDFGLKYGLKMHNLIEWDCARKGGEPWGPISDWQHIAEDAGSGDALDRYYIHPDCLHLLEPQAGDFLLSKDGRGHTVTKIIKGEWVYFNFTNEPDHPINWGFIFPDSKIIRRNGKPFPEIKSEEVCK